MDQQTRNLQAMTRRHFFSQCNVGVGAMALASLGLPGGGGQQARASRGTQATSPLAPSRPHFSPRAKSVIYLHMAGSPPQLDLFDHKPKLNELNDKPCPEEFLKGERFAFIKGTPKLLGSPYSFSRQGQSGTVLSELWKHFPEVIDDVAVVRSLYTEQFNHAPAQMFLYTGSSQFGHPSMGSWVTYGLGSENQNLPGFVVLVSGGKVPSAGKSVWGSGFLPSVYQGVQCRTSGDPVLYVSNPQGMSRSLRRLGLDAIGDLNRMRYERHFDPETLTRIAQYEMAYRMQISVPQVMDISKEPAHIHEMYGSTPGGSSFANNCLLARRMVEQGVRFVQLFDWGWDNHGTNPSDDLMHQLPKKMKQTDQPIAALIADLKQRGLLEETLIVWSGEFGRTPMNEKRNNSKFLGRDHHPHAMTAWLAGGGIKGGVNYGATDELGYFATDDRMHIHDLQALILHQLGLNHRELTYNFQGLDHRLTGVTREAVLHHELLG